jgi:hypothetical protein
MKNGRTKITLTIPKPELDALDRAIELSKTKNVYTTDVKYIRGHKVKVYLEIDEVTDLFYIGESFASIKHGGGA